MSTMSTHVYDPTTKISLAAKIIIGILMSVPVMMGIISAVSPQAMHIDLKSAFSTAPVAPANPATPAQPAIGSNLLNVAPATNPAPAPAAAPAAPVKAPAASVPAPTRLDGMKATNGNYITKGGDTLGQIAAANGKSVAHLASVNGISNPHIIRVGMTLKMDGQPKPRSNPSPAASSAPQASSGSSVTLVKGARLTSGVGARWGTQHKGIDLAAPIGTDIKAPKAGTVISSGPATGFGQWVRIRHADGKITVYGHINRSFVKVGQKVNAGDVIAEVGNRGQSTGPHLHFEVRGGTATSSPVLSPTAWLNGLGVNY